MNNTNKIVEFDENGAPKSRIFEDCYFSNDNGALETEYVFLQHNQLSERFKQLPENGRFTIYETGFGTGLNFIKAVELFLQTAPVSTELLFVSFEKYPLSAQQIKQSLQAFPELFILVKELAENYPLTTPGWHQQKMFNHRVTLILWVGDVHQGLPEFSTATDAWFLDGFAPARNPDMWQPALFKQMNRLSHSSTTFATFTAAGKVRRGLEDAGFDVEKDKGFGRKREMCFGRLNQPRPFHSKTPWYDLPPAVLSTSKRAVVVGAGLAGATVAYQLATQGYQVTVLEAEKDVARQASGNLAGAIHPLITADWNLRSQFYMRGFESTLKWLLPWLQAGEITGDLNGLKQLLMDDTAKQRVADGIERADLPEEFVKHIFSESADQMSSNAAWFPRGGWMYPKSVVERCLQHDNIRLHRGCMVQDIVKKSQAWEIIADTIVVEADVVVVATGALDQDLNQKLGVLIRPLKGQVTHLTEEHMNYPLDSVVTHQGYSVSWQNEQGNLCGVTGATFEAPDLSSASCRASDQANIEMARRAMPGWLTVADDDDFESKVGFRPTTADHLPLVGAVVDPQWAQQQYYDQRHSQASYHYDSQKYQPGLFVSNGHGARGLMSVFLAAEMIGFLVDGKPPCVPRKIIEACHPERFRIRSWRSGKKQARGAINHV